MTSTNESVQTVQPLSLNTIMIAFIRYCYFMKEIRDFPSPLSDARSWHKFFVSVHSAIGSRRPLFSELSYYSSSSETIESRMLSEAGKMLERDGDFSEKRWKLTNTRLFKGIGDMPEEIAERMFEIARAQPGFFPAS